MTGALLSSTLGEAVNEVLETMFFVDTEEQPFLDRPQEDLIEARLRFEGGPSGSLRLRINNGAARTLAADFLGEDAPEVSAARTQEVVTELANMICGCFLSRIAGEETTFRLSAPSANNLASGLNEAFGEGLVYRFALPDGGIAVILQVDGEVL
jgi:CheY-specific phosphatase CheX